MELTSKIKNEPGLHVLMENPGTGDSGNDAMLEDSYKYRTMFMEALFNNFNPKELVNTYVWAMRVIRTRGMDGMLWDIQLKKMREILREKLSTHAFSEIEPIYDWMITVLPDVVNIVDSEIDKSGN